MRILYVLNPLLDDYNKSGSARVAISLANGLFSKGHEVGIIANSSVSKYLSNGIKIYTPEIIRGYMKETIKFVASIAKENYDIVHIHIHQIGVLRTIREMESEIGIPVVYTQHTKNISNQFTFKYYVDARELSMNTDHKIRIIFPSYSMIDTWKEYCKYKGQEVEFPNIRIVRNGITDVKLPNNIDEKYNIITCSGIDKDKKISSVLDFVNQHKINSLFIADKRNGSIDNNNLKYDEYYDNFMNLMEETESAEHIRYACNSDVRKYMAMSKIYMTATESESFGLTIAEAISVGTPVLYVEEPSLCELLDDKSSVMIPKDEVNRRYQHTRVKIYKKYYDILIDKINSGEITRESTINRFNELGCDHESFINNHIKVYEELL